MTIKFFVALINTRHDIGTASKTNNKQSYRKPLR